MGTVATLMDMGSLILLVKWAGLTADQANFPSLAMGAIFQFFTHRHYVFRAASGSISKQAVLFTIVELIALGLNGVVYHWIISGTSVNYVLARPLGTAIVYCGFSFPFWRWIFKVPPKEKH